MYKAISGQLPDQITKLYKPNTIIHEHNTRQHSNPHIRYRRTQLALKQINHKGPELWQNVPLEIKTRCKNVKHFTKLYKIQLLISN